MAISLQTPAPACRLRPLLRAVCASVALSVSHPALSGEADPWQIASVRSGVPVEILHGIALTESGRVWSDGNKRPWPWTLNSPTTGSQFFRTRRDAEGALLRLVSAGVSNVDVGLMQINVGWHGHRVNRVVDLLDPSTNIRVAGEILAEYRQVKGDLAPTVGAYHAGPGSSRAERSKWYQDTVAQHVRRMRRSRSSS